MRNKNDGKFGPGNPGKPKGAVNQTTKEFRESLHEALKGDIERIPEYLKELNARDKLDALSKLLPYVMPKYQSIEIDGSITQQSIDLSAMPESELVHRTKLVREIERFHRERPDLAGLSTEELERLAKEKE